MKRKKFLVVLNKQNQIHGINLNETVKINDILDTEVVNIVDFGIFVKVHDEIDGMVHVSDLSWDEKKCQQTLEQFKKGDKVKVKILEINVEKERISLGIKQLESDPLQEFLDKNPLKSMVSGKIIEIDDKFLKISLDNNIIGTIKRSNLSKDKNEQRVDRFALEEQVDSIIISVDQKTRTLNLSIKEIEINDEKEALSKYGSSDSGASLGDILGSILKKKE
jgi:small subunit ribosomal protein S1